MAKKVNVYLSSGYLDFAGILGAGCPLNTIVGGRGTGKTYGFFKHCIEHGLFFLYLRRSQTQTEIITDRELSPLIPYCMDSGKNYEPYKMRKSIYGIAEVGEDGEMVGECLGMCTSLSVFANLRGFSGAQIDIIAYDEFIPEPQERTLKNEGKAVLNMIETVQRNRELSGKPPVKVVLMANADTLENPFFVYNNLIPLALKQRQEGINCKAYPRRHLLMVDLFDSPISAAKNNTWLYEFARGTEFADMAIDNSYGGGRDYQTDSKALIEYRPVVIVGTLCIYKHKDRNEYYVTEHVSGSPPRYSDDPYGLASFRAKHKRIYEAYLRKKVKFESIAVEIRLTEYFGR